MCPAGSSPGLQLGLSPAMLVLLFEVLRFEGRDGARSLHDAAASPTPAVAPPVRHAPRVVDLHRELARLLARDALPRGAGSGEPSPVARLNKTSLSKLSTNMCESQAF